MNRSDTAVARPGSAESTEESNLAERVYAALDTVLDPEIDEPVTTLGFVSSCQVDDAGAVTVRLRLPTFYCAPNFTYLMVADAHDALSAVAGVTSVDVAVQDHHAAEEINLGVAAGDGFSSVFSEETTADLAEIRKIFLTKAVTAGQDRVARPLVDAGATPSDLVATTLGAVADSVDLQRLRARRQALGLPSDDAAPLLMDAAGQPVPLAQVPLHLRRARLTRVAMETNGQYCTQMLKVRYDLT